MPTRDQAFRGLRAPKLFLVLVNHNNTKRVLAETLARVLYQELFVSWWFTNTRNSSGVKLREEQEGLANQNRNLNKNVGKMYTADGGGTGMSLGAHVADEVLRIALAPIVHDVLPVNPSMDASDHEAEQEGLW
jgi:hypothetical protein